MANTRCPTHALKSWVPQLTFHSNFEFGFSFFFVPLPFLPTLSPSMLHLDENFSRSRTRCVYPALGAQTLYRRQEGQCKRQAGLRGWLHLPSSKHSCRKRQSRSKRGITSSSRRAVVTDDLPTAQPQGAALAGPAGAGPAAVWLLGVSVGAEGAADSITLISRVAFTWRSKERA